MIYAKKPDGTEYVVQYIPFGLWSDGTEYVVQYIPFGLWWRTLVPPVINGVKVSEYLAHENKNINRG